MEFDLRETVIDAELYAQTMIQWLPVQLQPLALDRWSYYASDFPARALDLKTSNGLFDGRYAAYSNRTLADKAVECEAWAVSHIVCSLVTKELGALLTQLPGFGAKRVAYCLSFDGAEWCHFVARACEDTTHLLGLTSPTSRANKHAQGIYQTHSYRMIFDVASAETFSNWARTWAPEKESFHIINWWRRL